MAAECHMQRHLPVFAVGDFGADVTPASVERVELLRQDHRVGLRRLADDVTSGAVQTADRRLHVANRRLHVLNHATIRRMILKEINY